MAWSGAWANSRYTSIKTRIETAQNLQLNLDSYLSLHFHQNKD